MHKGKAKGVPCTLIPTIQKCSSCGADYDTDHFDLKNPLPKMMVERKLCFGCAFWIDKIENPLPYREIINGQHYVFNPLVEGKLYFQGHGGRKFYAIRNDKTTVYSNNVWFQGDIPEIFRDQLPDTAKFISKEIFQKLQSNPHICKSKGCWDRYHCLRYDISIEKESGPWNTIPEGYEPGGEDCEIFINQEELEERSNINL